MVRRLNIDGDGQGDREGHGGENRAVLVYQLASYQRWERELGRGDLTPGAFGENLTVDGLPDNEVCIGDHYRIGDVVFEVTQPRVTCYRVGVRIGEPQMAALLVAHHRPGFTAACSTRVNSKRDNTSSKSATSRSKCLSPRSTRCCICRDIRETTSNAPYAFRR